MGGGCPLTVSLVLSVLSEDVGVAFSFESFMLYSKWLVKKKIEEHKMSFF